MSPQLAGKPWSQEENDSLIKEFEERKSLNELAQSHRRTSFAIRSRLVKLGKISF